MWHFRLKSFPTHQRWELAHLGQDGPNQQATEAHNSRVAGLAPDVRVPLSSFSPSRVPACARLGFSWAEMALCCDYSHAWSTATNSRSSLRPSSTQLALKWPSPKSPHWKDNSSPKAPVKDWLQVAWERCFLSGGWSASLPIWDLTLFQRGSAADRQCDYKSRRGSPLTCNVHNRQVHGNRK